MFTLRAVLFCALALAVPRVAYASLSISSLAPVSGPTSGGTVIAVSYTSSSFFDPSLPGHVFIQDSSGTAIPETAVDVPGGFLLAMPPHAAEAVTVLVINSVFEIATKTFTYASVSSLGAISAIDRVTLAGNGAEAAQPLPFQARSTNGGSASSGAAMSNGARFVAFLSNADLGLPLSFLCNSTGQPTQVLQTVILKDTLDGALTRISTTPTGCVPISTRISSQVAISLDGSHVAYNVGSSDGANVYDVQTGTTTGVVNGIAGPAGSFHFSASGQMLAFTDSGNIDGNPADDPTSLDIFVRDFQTGMLERWSTGLTQFGARMDMSADGHYLTFTTGPRLFLVDRIAGLNGQPFLQCLVCSADQGVSALAFASDGKTIVFSSGATNLVPDFPSGGTFAYDVASGVITGISPIKTPVLGVSGNGRRVAFTDGTVFDRDTGVVFNALAAADGTPAANPATIDAISVDGHTVLFSTIAQNLVPDDTNLLQDVFVKTLPADSPAGSNIAAEPVDSTSGQSPVQLLFSNINMSGNTSLMISSDGPPPPAGFAIGSPATYYNVSTTAGYSGPIQVCIDYSALTVDESSLTLLHFDGTTWQDVTTSIDKTHHVICGETASLSPFVVASALAVDPSITWPPPDPIVYGTPLGNVQFDATASAAGTFTYSPTAGTVLSAGVGQSLRASFVPDDRVHYLPITAAISIDVLRATLQVTADNKIRILGAVNPSFTASYVGLVAGDNQAVISGTPTLTTAATPASSVGAYPITISAGTLVAANYSFAFSPGSLTVTYAPAGTCMGEPGHAILAPVQADGSSVFKQGASVPIKFRVCNADGQSIGTPGVVSAFSLVGILNGTTLNEVQDQPDSNTPDEAFRWDSTSQQWIFNIGTKTLAANRTYIYEVRLNDGTSIRFQFGLR